MDHSKNVTPVEKPQARRRLLVEHDFQLSVVRLTCGLVVATAAICFAAHAYSIWRIQKLGQDIGLPANHVFFDFVAEQRAQTGIIFAVLAALVSVVAVGAVLYLSHRVAGSIHRLKKHLDEVIHAERPETDLRFREADYFHELADLVSRICERASRAPVSPEAEAKRREAS